MSKNKQDLGPYRRKQFQTYFQFSLIAICFVIIFVLFYACTGSSIGLEMEIPGVKVLPKL